MHRLCFPYAVIQLSAQHWMVRTRNELSAKGSNLPHHLHDIYRHCMHVSRTFAYGYAAWAHPVSKAGGANPAQSKDLQTNQGPNTPCLNIGLRLHALVPSPVYSPEQMLISNALAVHNYLVSIILQLASSGFSAAPVFQQDMTAPLSHDRIMTWRRYQSWDCMANSIRGPAFHCSNSAMGSTWVYGPDLFWHSWQAHCFCLKPIGPWIGPRIVH